MKTVCLFGIYDSNYARNRVLISGFKSNGYRVVECRVDPKLRSIKFLIQIVGGSITPADYLYDKELK